MILLAGLHFMWKHNFNFDVYEAAGERENKRIGRYPVAMGRLLDSLKHDPPANLGRWDSWLARKLIRERRTVAVWSWAFGLLLLIDVVIFLHAAGAS